MVVAIEQFATQGGAEEAFEGGNRVIQILSQHGVGPNVIGSEILVVEHIL